MEDELLDALELPLTLDDAVLEDDDPPAEVAADEPLPMAPDVPVPDEAAWALLEAPMLLGSTAPEDDDASEDVALADDADGLEAPEDVPDVPAPVEAPSEDPAAPLEPPLEAGRHAPSTHCSASAHCVELLQATRHSPSLRTWDAGHSLWLHPERSHAVPSTVAATRSSVRIRSFYQHMGLRAFAMVARGGMDGHRTTRTARRLKHAPRRITDTSKGHARDRRRWA